MSGDLVAFLHARLDEDAAIAASGESWSEFDESVHGTRRVDVDHSFERVVACTRAWRGVHIARHDPARVLAEVEAKRQIAEVHAVTDEKTDTDPFDAYTGKRRPDEYSVTCAICGWVSDDRTSGCLTLRLLAAVYRHHPDYRPEWAP